MKIQELVEHFQELTNVMHNSSDKVYRFLNEPINIISFFFTDISDHYYITIRSR